MEKYSVLMSVYYKENPQYLMQSIESILKQTVKADEFVIVCDGTLTDELDAVLLTYENEYPELFKIIRQDENKGLGVALNLGLNSCKNSIIARMDSDDISLPDRIETELKMMENQDVDIVSGTVIEFIDDINNETTRRVLPQNSDEIMRFAKRRNPFNHPAVIYKKESVIKAGGYKDFMLFEDYFLWVRMFLCGARGYNIEKPLLYMRSGVSFYTRRGGIKYVRQIVKFRWFMLKSGFIGIVDFVITVTGHSLIALIPNKMRTKFYERVLRR